MNKNISKIILGALFVLTFVIMPTVVITGCITASNPTGTVVVGGVTLNPKATGDAVRIAAKLGAVAAIQQNPELRPDFLKAAVALELVLTTTNTTPESIKACFSTIISDPIALDMLNDAVQLYSDYFGVLIANKLEKQSPYILPVLLNLSKGIREACVSTAPK